MAEECGLHDCHFSENGTCKFHGVEVERRENSTKLIDALSELMNKVSIKLTWVSEKMNWVLGWAVLITILVGGAYAYTREVKVDLSARQAADTAVFTTSIKELTAQVSRVAVEQGRTEERYDALLREMKSTTELIRATNEQISSLRSEEYDNSARSGAKRK